MIGKFDEISVIKGYDILMNENMETVHDEAYETKGKWVTVRFKRLNKIDFYDFLLGEHNDCYGGKLS